MAECICGRSVENEGDLCLMCNRLNEDDLAKAKQQSSFTQGRVPSNQVNDQFHQQMPLDESTVVKQTGTGRIVPLIVVVLIFGALGYFLFNGSGKKGHTTKPSLPEYKASFLTFNKSESCYVFNVEDGVDFTIQLPQDADVITEQMLQAGLSLNMPGKKLASVLEEDGGTLIDGLYRLAMVDGDEFHVIAHVDFQSEEEIPKFVETRLIGLEDKGYTLEEQETGSVYFKKQQDRMDFVYIEEITQQDDVFFRLGTRSVIELPDFIEESTEETKGSPYDFAEADQDSKARESAMGQSEDTIALKDIDDWPLDFLTLPMGSTADSTIFGKELFGGYYQHELLGGRFVKNYIHVTEFPESNSIQYLIGFNCKLPVESIANHFDDLLTSEGFQGYYDIYGSRVKKVYIPKAGGAWWMQDDQQTFYQVGWTLYDKKVGLLTHYTNLLTVVITGNELD